MIKEWQRTVILVILLAFAIGFLLWSQAADSSFVQPT